MLSPLSCSFIEGLAKIYHFQAVLMLNSQMPGEDYTALLGECVRSSLVSTTTLTWVQVHNETALANLPKEDVNFYLVIAESAKLKTPHSRRDIIFFLTNDECIAGLELKLYSTVISSAQVNGSSALWRVREHYAIKGQRRSEVIGTWDDDEGCFSEREPPPLIWDRRSDLNNGTVQVTILPWDPVALKTEEGWTGFIVELLEMLGKELNFRVEYQSNEDGIWGTKTGETWNGMVGDLVEGKADVCAGIIQTLDRVDYIDFTVRSVVTKLTIFARSPGSGGTPVISSLFYASVFTAQAWLALAGVGLVQGIAGHMLTSTHASLGDDENKCWNLKNFLGNTGKGLVFFGQSLLQLDCAHSTIRQPLPVSARVLEITLKLLGLFAFAAYTSDLTATMTSSSPRALPTSFGEILSRNYRILLPLGSVSTNFMAQAEKGSPANVAYEQNAEVVYFEENKILNRLLDDPETLYFGSSINFPGITALVKSHDFRDGAELDVGFALQKDSEFTDLFNHHLRKIEESGLLRRIKEKWLQEGLEDMTARIFVEDARPIQAENVVLPASVVVVAAAVASAVLLGEMLWPRTHEVRIEITNAWA